MRHIWGHQRHRDAKISFPGRKPL